MSTPARARRTSRGEEDTERWDLLLAGRVTVTGAVGRHLSVLAAVLATVGAAVVLGSIGTIAYGRRGLRG